MFFQVCRPRITCQTLMASNNMFFIVILIAKPSNIAMITLRRIFYTVRVKR
jgi:hypothetical protein